MTANPREKYTSKQVSIAAQLWSEGATMEVMSERLGMPVKNVRYMIDCRRGAFPYRKNNVRRHSPAFPPLEQPAEKAPVCKPGCVIRTMPDGAKITLPRVSFIDGPEPGDR